MLVVRVEIWPGGDSRRLSQIEALTVVNVGLVEDGKHAYEVRSAGRFAQTVHRQSDGALALVARAIAALDELENNAVRELISDSRRRGRARASAGTTPRRRAVRRARATSVRDER